MPRTSLNPVTGPRARHEQLVLDTLRRQGPTSRGDLTSATGLSRATVSSLAGGLLARGRLVVLPSPQDVRAGRPPELLALDPTGGRVLGIDFGHSRVTIVVADAAHEVVGSGTRRYARSTSWTHRCEIAVTAARELLAGNTPTAVGLGVPGGFVNHPRVVETVTTAFSTEFVVPLRTDNNARLAGLAETVWGGARGLTDVAYVRLSAGVGGALVLGGRIHRGPNGTAGEFGHVCVDPAGPVCRCSHQGCLEAFVGLERVLADTGVTTITELQAACEAGDRTAVAVVAAAGRRVGGVLAGVGTVVGVRHFVLGGELASLGEHLTAATRTALRRQLLLGSGETLHVEVAALGDYAGALGAIAAVLHDTTLDLTSQEIPALPNPEPFHREPADPEPVHSTR